MKNGVPYHVATEVLTDVEVLAHGVAFAEFEGQRFDWVSMKYERRVDA